MAVWNIGSKNGMWHGGRVSASNGYILIRVGLGHHLADCRGYAYEHRIVMEKKLGRKLRQNELVHHKDGNKQNNLPSNLEVEGGNSEHQFAHRRPGCKLRKPGEVNPIVKCACGCGAKFKRFDSVNRPRKYISGHNLRG